MQNKQAELILLVFIYHSLVTYGILFYVVSQSARINKKYLTMSGLACLLIGTLPPLVLAPDNGEISAPMLMFMSTLFHLFSHLGHSLLLLSVYSIMVPFVSKARTFTISAYLSSLVKLATLLQGFIDRHLMHRIFASLSMQVFFYWCIISVCLVLYSLTADTKIDREIEEALILTRYYEVRRNPNQDQEDDDDDNRMFRPSSVSMKTTKHKDKKEGDSQYLRDEMDEGLQPLGA